MGLCFALAISLISVTVRPQSAEAGSLNTFTCWTYFSNLDAASFLDMNGTTDLRTCPTYGMFEYQVGIIPVQGYDANIANNYGKDRKAAR